uniref:DUF4220 domain-containing protein n=1 Tax=Oryza glumipatula TaxID=40148 RepID=A0A0D9ZGR8_9ORYZ
MESEGLVRHRWGRANIGAPCDAVVLVGWGNGGTAAACHRQSCLPHHRDIDVLASLVIRRRRDGPCKGKSGTDRVDPTQEHPAALSTSSDIDEPTKAPVYILFAVFLALVDSKLDRDISQFISSLRGLVIFSFIAHFFLVFFAGLRRHQPTGVRMFILWGANQFARWAPVTVLGTLSVGSTPQKEQLGGDAMLWISSVVLLMAIGKYWEGAYQALMRGNLKNMQSSRKKMKNKRTKSVRNSLQIARRGGREPNEEQLLLAAHDMLSITKDAFIDFLDKTNADEQEALSDTWDEKLYRVVNMKLSLMYDLIYTKAAMVHTWKVYAIRCASPIAGATAFVLFCLNSKEGQSTVDVIITYVLLAGTVILDIKWLLRAVASTWFYSFMDEKPRSTLLCSGKWRLIRRLIVSDLNLFRFLANSKKPTRYRMWSETIGQFNLMEECTRYESEPRTKNLKSSMFKQFAPEDKWMEYEYQHHPADSTTQHQVKAIKALSDYMMFLVAVRSSMLPGLVLSSLYEAVSDALAGIWKENGGSDPSSRTSSSTMRKKRLANILIEKDRKEGKFVEKDESEPDKGFLIVLYDTSNVLSEGTLLARFLLGEIPSIHYAAKTLEEKFDRQYPFLMELAQSRSGYHRTADFLAVTTDAILREWARQLNNVSIRRTRDSHAKQLARGEFTTVVWILAEHARILRVKKPN